MGLLTPVAIRVGRLPWLPRYLPRIVAVDETLQRVTGGRVALLDLAGLPNLVLTVPGRRTGTPRSTPLLCVPGDGHYLIAGSNFGGPTEPIWVKNLEAAMAGTVRVGRIETPFTARALVGEERDRAWSRMVRTWPNFEHYQAHTARLIKLFELTVAAGPRG